MKKNNPKDKKWADAKSKCRLSSEHIRKAKELGINPLSLIKNIPAPTEHWKLPVSVWIDELYQKHVEKMQKKLKKKSLESNFKDEDSCSSPEDKNIREQTELLIRQQKHFQLASEYIAAELAKIPAVEKVVLFGSVAKILPMEVPRFRSFKRSQIKLPHECRDVDIAVWLSDLSDLRVIQKVRHRALQELFQTHSIGVAHHQVDIFLMEYVTNKFLGFLCHYTSCPKGKSECKAENCGRELFLKQTEGFYLQSDALNVQNSHVLFDRLL